MKYFYLLIALILLTTSVFAANRYWVGGSGTWDSSSTTHWSTTSGGGGGASVPTSTDDVLINSSSGSGTIKFNNPNSAINSINFSPPSNSDELDLLTDLNVLGSFVIGNGVFDANNKNVTINSMNLSGTNSKDLRMGSGTWTVKGSGLSGASRAWICNNGVNVIITPQTSTIIMENNNTGDTNFRGGGKTYNNLWWKGGAGNNYLNLENTSATFNDLKIDANSKVRFGAGLTYQVTSLTATGTAGNLIKLQSTATNTKWNLKQTSGTVSSDYLSLQDSNAYGGATFYAGANSTDVNNNNGWVFTSPGTPTARINWNIYRTGTSTNLTNVNADCNVNAMDFSNQNSPVTGVYVDQGTSFTCDFTRTGYDSNTGYVGTVDSNKTLTIYLADTTKPVTNISGNTSATWTTTNQTIALSCTDAGSGCASTQYKIDAGAWITYTTPFTISTDGNHQIDYNSTDGAGNVEVTKTAYAAIDKTEPFVNSTNNSGFTIVGSQIWGTGNITATANDSTSGIASCDYSIDNGSHWFAASYNGTQCYKNGITVATPGTHYTFALRATNGAGTIGYYAFEQNAYVVDNVKPSTTFSGCTSGWHTTNQTITLTCTDATSGCASTSYNPDGEGATPYIIPFLLSGDGNHSIAFYSIDNATNTEVTKTEYCAIDKTNPSVGQTYTNGFTIFGNYIKGTGIISATATDATSGINNCEYTIDNGSNWLSADKNATHCYKNLTITNGVSYKFNLRATDNATNTGTGTAVASTYTGDTTAPVTTLETTTIQDNNNWLTFGLTCTDNASGCASTTWRIDSGVWHTLDTNKNDYNSTEERSTQAAYQVYQTYFFTNKTRNDLNGTAKQYVKSITNQMKETSSATARVKYHLVFMDGTDENTTENTMTTSTYTTKTFTVTTQNKDVNYVETLLACDSGTTSCYFQDTNIIYSETNPWIDYNAIGYHYIDYNSVDNIGNVETTKRSDLNMPVLLTVKAPKNIQTLVKITEKWSLATTGGLIINLTDLNASQDYNFYVQYGQVTTFYIADMNGNYATNTYTRTYYADSNNGTTDTLQPYLYSFNTSLSAIITAVDAKTNLPIPGVTIKVYGNLPGFGNTLIGQVTTDSKGQAIQQFFPGNAYTLQVYYQGIFIKTFTINATGTAVVLILDLGTTVIPTPTNSGFTATWTPIGGLQTTTGTQQFTQTLLNFGDRNISIISTLTQNGVNLGAPQNYSGTSNKTFTYNINWNDINTGTIISKMIVTTSDGNTYTYTKNIIVSTGFGTGYNPIYGLTTGLRQDFTCDPNPLIPCYPLLVIAIIICIGLTLWATVQFGIMGSQSAGLIFLVSMILFTALTWIPVWITAGLVIIILAFIVNERR